MKGRLAAVILLMLAAGLARASAPPWPTPLTLEFVLQHLDQTHPDLRLAEAVQQRAGAALLRAESTYGLRSSLLGRLRWVEPPPTTFDPSHQDHRVAIRLRKRLYDFGRAAGQTAAAEAEQQAGEAAYHDALNRYRIAVMAAYFDVILADLEQARDNEAMSIGFVTYDRAKARNELGQVSDIELLRLESEYQLTRARQHASSARQRTARQQLANLLNRPDDLPAELTPPDLPDVTRAIPEVEAWFTRAETASPALQAGQAALEAARQRLDAAKASARPLLDGRAEAARYSREGGSNDLWRFGLYLEVPLLTGGETRAQVAAARAEVLAAEAALEGRRRSVRQAVLDLWSALQSLRARRQELAVLADYRDLYLDNSRALYELEVKSDLGDAMVQTTDVSLQRARTDYEIALTWARIRALLGENPIAIEEARP